MCAVCFAPLSREEIVLCLMMGKNPAAYALYLARN